MAPTWKGLWNSMHDLSSERLRVIKRRGKVKKGRTMAYGILVNRRQIGNRR